MYGLSTLCCVYIIYTQGSVSMSSGHSVDWPNDLVLSSSRLSPLGKKNAGKQKQKATTAGPSSPLENCPCVSAFRVTFPLLYTFGTFPDRTLLLLLLVKYQGKRTVSFLSFLFFLLFPNLFYCQHFKWSSIDLRFFFYSFEGKKNPVDKSLRAGEKKKKRWVHGPSVKKKKNRSDRFR